MRKHITYCRPDGNRFNWEKPEMISLLPNDLAEYGRVKVTFEKYVPMKSMLQLGYYFAGILPYLEKRYFLETGMTKDDWHYTLKDMFGMKRGDKSQMFVIVESVAKYTEKEMWFYIEKIKQWAFDFFGEPIPEPKRIEEFL